MELRDEIETVLRAWHAYEVGRGSPEIIDFDCHPTDAEIEPAGDRLAVHRRLTELLKRAEKDGNADLISRLTADLAYLGAILGERPPLADYISATQGCGAAGWPEAYVARRGEEARQALAAVGIGWGPETAEELHEFEGPMDIADASDAIREAAADHESAVRGATGSDAGTS
ncbi:hypothetical protein [Spirillospora sp. CA-294931]|uniref:hypothetical protein n=1 Tax=Spirillospora sp. CA-294931 TaxID=3240042 RepID=UPI003D900E48